MDNNHRYDIIHGLCMRFADETGDKSFARASRALLWEPCGRKPKTPQADNKAISDALQLVESGSSPSLHSAFVTVAKTKWPYSEPRSVAERLRRRFKRTRAST